MLAVKPVGEPDAGNPHVRFDERGGETDCSLAAPRPSSNSTVESIVQPHGGHGRTAHRPHADKCPTHRTCVGIEPSMPIILTANALAGRDHLVGASPTRAMVGWPGSWQAVRLGNRLDRSPATNVALGGGANRRAVTRVKPEQASKGKLWTPTRPEFGEGSTIWGSSRQTHLDRSTGVMGTARRRTGDRVSGGGPCWTRVAASTVP